MHHSRFQECSGHSTKLHLEEKRVMLEVGDTHCRHSPGFYLPRTQVSNLRIPTRMFSRPVPEMMQVHSSTVLGENCQPFWAIQDVFELLSMARQDPALAIYNSRYIDRYLWSKKALQRDLIEQSWNVQALFEAKPSLKNCNKHL